ncbi:acyltransferase [Clostridium beijerinckii]|uniref:acyltransferase n=1 Tax=Clostridium beijerinckii TaxID=1520 RepID=UPI001360F5CB|nr:N-acetyltransferase [Clostridium beijerinckii]MZK49879.1 N-acetyltransferase [Clostridium beijerinckii]MZK57838.1 N-acetyltransferase [Clostridium beijerinckii]MZK68049.1 N-acetyltransferase [Clostridium beijerinckii]MZK73547.1 N-acetyltransferase [Clostridium beijerinckii]MZK83129.1 N-acetyltransferase [Clostridium beijerinckii]
MERIVDDTSIIGNNVEIKEGVIIGKNVIIEENCFLDYGAIIRDNVHIKRDSYIGIRCILGEFQQDFFIKKENLYHPLVIGENSIIRSETIVYGDTVIGDNFQTGHRSTIRENTKIGNNCRVGTLSDIQGDCIIGNYVSLHSNVHIGQRSIIKDYVWVFPYVVLTNDPTPPSDNIIGVTIEEFSVISTGSIILPGIKIGRDCLVGAGALVNRNVSDEDVVVGNPAKRICSIHDIKNKITDEKVYPWREKFSRGMPWEGQDYGMWIKNNA